MPRERTTPAPGISGLASCSTRASTAPDPRDFRALGGKFIMYPGWSDQAINPRNSVNYLNSVADFFARHERRRGHGGGESKRQISSFIRLFMIPSMPHCLGGPGVK